MCFKYYKYDILYPILNHSLMLFYVSDSPTQDSGSNIELERRVYLYEGECVSRLVGGGRSLPGVSHATCHSDQKEAKV